MKLILVIFTMCFFAGAQAQDWDEAQTELWGVVAQSWVDDAGETGKWPGAYIHESVVSWGAEWPVPRGAKSVAKWTQFRDANSKMLEYELFPLAIVVEGDTGVVHYSVVSVRKNSEGKNKRSVGGLVETLHRFGGSWKYISLVGFSMNSDGD
jgi:hypothetical protein